MPWALIGLTLLALILLYGPSPGYYDHRLWRSLWGVGHGIFFAVLTLLLLRWCLGGRTTKQWHVVGWIIASLGIAAVVSEAAQLLTPHRQAGIGDLSQNFLGIALGVMISPHLLALISRRKAEATVLLALPLCVGLALPPWITLADTLHGRKQFPVLLAMESPFEVLRLGGTERRQWIPGHSASEASLLQLAFEPPGSGFGLRHFPADWRGYQQLRFRIYSDNALPVTVRVHDRHHEQGIQLYEDRFNRRYELVPGWQTLTVPLAAVEQAPRDRAMDLAAITGIGLFNSALEQSHALKIGEVRLVMEP